MIYITGDIHGTFSAVYNLCDRIQPTKDDVIVLLGDVGANYDGGARDTAFKKQLSEFPPIFFCIHGNHENRPQNVEGYIRSRWNGGEVFYQKEYPKLLFPIDGEIFVLNGLKCLVIGGAYSVDKYFRLRRGSKWFEDEQPSAEIKSKVMEQIQNNKIDVVFSHTCPLKYTPTECFLPSIDQSMVDKSTEEFLDAVEENTSYKAWYCGHWHINKRIDKIHFLYHNVEILTED